MKIHYGTASCGSCPEPFKGKHASALACTMPSYHKHENLLLEIHTSVRVVIMCQRVWGRGGGLLSSWLNKNKMEEREHLSKAQARTRGDKEKTLHWPGIVKKKIAAKSSQKTQYPPQFTFGIRNHFKSSVNRVTTAVGAAHAMFPVLNVPSCSLSINRKSMSKLTVRLDQTTVPRFCLQQQNTYGWANGDKYFFYFNNAFSYVGPISPWCLNALWLYDLLNAWARRVVGCSVTLEFSI